MYEEFLKIDGTHPWRNVSPEGYVDYPVRYRKGGRVIFFNFSLAKEIGLIPEDHPPLVTTRLKRAVLRTFSLQILNEHDWLHRKSFPRDHLMDRLYMATRYLQSQHKNKRGETSGDGRSIWNGYFRNPQKMFDISSCGTGSTILSPGAQEANEPLQTGSTEFGYASGLADLDEMLSAAIMSEVFYQRQYPTERTLAVIDFVDKTAIGVRTSPNLIRPAHIFRYLKSDQYEPLKKSFNYFLDRQVANGVWKLPKPGLRRYQKALELLAKNYAKLSAVMEEEYIFNWLAWDGDNMLANGAILDYGSIRQFAAKHTKYRYEDVDRFSTSLTEQKFWARKIVQTFVQAVDFIVKKEKKPIEDFNQHPSLKVFDDHFEIERYRRMLWRVGFSPKQIEHLILHKRETVEAFRKSLNYFEHIRTSEGERRVPDGVDHPPVFLVRHILRELPLYVYHHWKKETWTFMPEGKFCQLMAASYVEAEDLQMNEYRKQMAYEFQSLYKELICAVSKKIQATLKAVARRSAVINYEFRTTGDGLVWIVNEAIKVRNKMKRQKIQECIDRFIKSQILVPGKWEPIRIDELKGRSMKARLLKEMQKNLILYSELI